MIRSSAAAAALRRKEENLRLLEDDLAARREVFRAMPDYVGLHTTDVCNLRCVMCPRSRRPGRSTLPRALLARALDETFPTARKAVVTAAAGEPLLADFDLVVERAREHCVRVDLITNGTLLTSDLYREARPVFDHVNVSVDAFDPALYRAVRGGDVARVTKNLAAIARLRRDPGDRVLLTLSAVVLRSNLSALPDFVRHAARFEVDAVLFQRLLHSVKASRDQDPLVDPGPDAVRRVFEDARAAARDVGVNLYFDKFDEAPVEPRPLRPRDPAPMEDRGVCWFVAQNVGLQDNGDVYPCCMPNDHRFGHLARASVRDLWNAAPARRLRRAHFSGRGTLFCRGCPFAPGLPAPRPAFLVTPARLARRAWSHLRRRVLPRLGTRARRRPATQRP